MISESAIRILTVAAVLAYLIAFALAFRKRPLALSAHVVGWCLSLCIFLIHWISIGEPPFGSMVHVLVAISLAFFPAWLALSRRDGLAWLLPYFSLAPAISLFGTLFMESSLDWQRVPALRSLWFVPHVASYVLSYALNAVAFILFLVAVSRRILRIANDTERYEGAIHRVLLLSFPLMTFGMLSGALWAEEAWGRYWSWDVKETWSLITWMLYLIYFHTRQVPRLRRFALPAQCCAFLALLTTFLVVNYGLIPRLESLLHSY